MIFLLIISALVGLVWAAVFLQRGALLVGCFALLVVGYCLGHPFLSFDLATTPLTLDRLLLLALVVSYPVLRWLGRVDPKPITGADWPLIGLVILLSLSTAACASATSTTGAGSSLWRLTASYWMPLCVYWLARQSRLTARGVRCVLAGLTLFGVYLAVTALAEVSEQWHLVFPRYIGDPTRGIHFGRARGPALASQSLGFYLSVCCLSAWVLRRLVRRSFQLALVAVGPLVLVAVYCTYTRAAWLAVTAGLLVVLLLELKGRWQVLVIGGALAGALLLFVTGADWLVSFRRESSAANARQSVYQRAGFAYVSWRMFTDRPLLGVGFGNFRAAKRPYLADRSVALGLDSLRNLDHHNTFLSVLTEAGMVGLGLFLAVLVSWSRAAWRVARSPVAPEWARAWGVLMLGAVVAYVCSALFHDATLSPTDQCLVFFVAGVTVGLQPWARTGPAPGVSVESAATAVPATV